MRRRPCALLTSLILLAGPAATAEAAPREDAGVQQQLVVGTKEAPPFAIKAEDGTWNGISIELWRGIADDLGLNYTFQERDLAELIEGLADGSLDASVAALTVTAPREEAIDFTHPFYTSGLGIAVTMRQRSAWLALLESVFSPAFLRVLLTLGLVLLAAGALVWFFERRANPDQFGGAGLEGLGAGFWWSAVTMTTVGYGDKAPRSTGGRAVALIWMFTSVIIISSFTAAIASTLTLSQIGSPVEGPGDLVEVRVGSVATSTSAAYLRDRSIRHETYSTAREALEALAAGEIDAVVYDAPILHYLALEEVSGVRVLPGTFERQDYAIGLPDGSELREPISLAILRRIGSPEWNDLLRRYLGR